MKKSDDMATTSGVPEASSSSGGTDSLPSPEVKKSDDIATISDVTKTSLTSGGAENCFEDVIHDQHSYICSNPKQKYIDLLLVGKTGNGKSSLGNAILRREAFVGSDDMSSVTKYMIFDYCEFEDTIIKVVDGPGVGDTDLNKKEGIEQVIDAMSNAIMANPQGYHAILIVARYGQRFTKEDVKAIQILKNIFGEGFIKDHAILVMTCGDLFLNMAKKKQIKPLFHEWCNTQTEPNFRKLFSEVGQRVTLFDNITEDESKQLEQLRQLLAVIEVLSTKGKRYTNAEFAQAKKSRDHALVSSEKTFLHEAAQREAALIMQKFQNVDFKNPENEVKRMTILQERAKKLILSIKEQDKGTSVLAESMRMAENMNKAISGEIDALNEIIKVKKEEEKTQKDEEEKRRILHEKLKQEETNRQIDQAAAEKRLKDEISKRDKLERELRNELATPKEEKRTKQNKLDLGLPFAKWMLPQERETPLQQLGWMDLLTQERRTPFQQLGWMDLLTQERETPLQQLDVLSNIEAAIKKAESNHNNRATEMRNDYQSTRDKENKSMWETIKGVAKKVATKLWNFVTFNW